MESPLINYLHDHLSGAAHALDLVQSLRDHFRHQPLGSFADTLHREIREDRDTLREIADRFGSGKSGLKEGAAWLSEKVMRLKLGHSDPSGLGTFEALEFLQIGIYGKLVLWEVLSQLSDQETRIHGVDFEELKSRAKQQIGSVNEYRIAEGRRIFVSQTTVIWPLDRR
jgi:hypothetical protein